MNFVKASLWAKDEDHALRTVRYSKIYNIPLCNRIYSLLRPSKETHDNICKEHVYNNSNYMNKITPQSGYTFTFGICILLHRLAGLCSTKDKAENINHKFYVTQKYCRYFILYHHIHLLKVM